MFCVMGDVSYYDGWLSLECMAFPMMGGVSDEGWCFVFWIVFPMMGGCP